MWTKLHTIPDLGWLDKKTRAAGEALNRRIAELLEVRGQHDVDMAALEAIPAERFGGEEVRTRHELAVHRLGLLQEEVALRGDIARWYESLRAEARTAVAAAQRAVDETAENVKASLVGIGYIEHPERRGFGIDSDMLGKHPRMRDARAKVQEIMPWQHVGDGERDCARALQVATAELQALRDRLMQLA